MAGVHIYSGSHSDTVQLYIAWCRGTACRAPTDVPHGNENRYIRFVTFREAGLLTDSSDRLVWCYAQANQMMILTANRNMKGEDSLEKVMREENTTDSFPVVTIGDIERLDEFDYRERCVDRLIEIVLDIENYMGVGRLFIP